MDKLNWYQGLLITPSIWQEVLDKIEDGINSATYDCQVNGIRIGGSVTAKSPATFFVEVEAMFGRDADGQRVTMPADQEIDCTQDTDGNPTAVSVAGKFKWLTLMIKYARLDQNPKVDGNGDTVYYNTQDYFELKLVQGAEADNESLATKSTKPSAEWLYLADIRRYDPQSDIDNADIDLSRFESVTIGNAKNIGFDNDSGRFDSGVDDVDEALEGLAESRETNEANISTLQGNALDLQRRYYNVALNNLRVYMDKSANLLYTMQADKYRPSEIDVAYTGTAFAMIFQTDKNATQKSIIFKMWDYTWNAGTYYTERIITTGDVGSPKIVYDGGSNFIVTWVVNGTSGYQVNSLIVSTANVIGGTLTADLNNVASQPLKGSDQKHYDIFYNSVTSRCGIIWGTTSDTIYFREWDPSTGTKYTAAQVDNSGSVVYPSLTSDGTYYVACFMDNAGSNVYYNYATLASGSFTATNEFVSAVASTVFDRPFIQYSSNESRFICGVLDGGSFKTQWFNTSWSPSSWSTFSGDSGIGKLYDLGYNTNSNEFVAIYQISSGAIRYLECTTASFAGSSVAFGSSTNDYWLTHENDVKLINTTEVNGEYKLFRTDGSLTGVFDLREFRIHRRGDQGTGNDDVMQFKQGSGGHIAYLLRNNPGRQIRASIGSYDGVSVSLSDEKVIAFDINSGDFSTNGITYITTDPQEDLTSFVYTFNRLFYAYRHDDVLVDGISVGNGSFTARYDKEMQQERDFSHDGSKLQVSELVLGLNDENALHSNDIYDEIRQKTISSVLRDIEYEASGRKVEATIGEGSFDLVMDKKRSDDVSTEYVSGETGIAFSQNGDIPYITIDTGQDEGYSIGDKVDNTTDSKVSYVKSLELLSGTNYRLYLENEDGTTNLNWSGTITVSLSHMGEVFDFHHDPHKHFELRNVNSYVESGSFYYEGPYTSVSMGGGVNGSDRVTIPGVVSVSKGDRVYSGTGSPDDYGPNKSTIIINVIQTTGPTIFDVPNPDGNDVVQDDGGVHIVSSSSTTQDMHLSQTLAQTVQLIKSGGLNRSHIGLAQKYLSLHTINDQNMPYMRLNEGFAIRFNYDVYPGKIQIYKYGLDPNVPITNGIVAHEHYMTLQMPFRDGHITNPQGLRNSFVLKNNDTARTYIEFDLLDADLNGVNNGQYLRIRITDALFERNQGTPSNNDGVELVIYDDSGIMKWVFAGDMNPMGGSYNEDNDVLLATAHINTEPNISFVQMADPIGKIYALPSLAGGKNTTYAHLLTNYDYFTDRGVRPEEFLIDNIISNVSVGGGARSSLSANVSLTSDPNMRFIRTYISANHGVDCIPGILLNAYTYIDENAGFVYDLDMQNVINGTTGTFNIWVRNAKITDVHAYLTNTVYKVETVTGSTNWTIGDILIQLVAYRRPLYWN